MNPTLSLSLIILVCFGASCKKSEEDNPTIRDSTGGLHTQVIDATIVGSWKLSSVEVDPDPEDISDTLLNTQIEVQFRADGTNTITIWDGAGKITDLIEGEYILEAEQLIISGKAIQSYRFLFSRTPGHLTLEYSGEEAAGGAITLVFSKQTQA